MKYLWSVPSLVAMFSGILLSPIRADARANANGWSLLGEMALSSPVAQVTSAVEVGRIAKAVTVTIDSPNSPGSGVLLQKNGNSYTVLTAAHVVKDRQQSFKVITNDGKEYKVTSIKSTKNADLAVVKFESTVTYPVSKLGDPTQASEGATVYVAGFPVATQTITASIYNFTEGKVTANASRPLADGYSLVYNNNTLPGMSGGPVLNDRGELIAIHGKGDVQTESKASDINQNVRIKTGFNLGITLSTVAQQSQDLGLNLTGVVAKPIVASNQPNADDFFLAGVERFRRSDWAGAKAEMDRAIQLRPDYKRAYIARGAASYMQNRLGQGLADMEKATQIDPRYGVAYVGLCFLYSEMRRTGDALGACNRAIELSPKLAIAYNTRGLVRLRFNDLGGAEQDLRQAIELDPKSYYPYGNLGLVYALRGNPQVALQYTRQALRLNPDSAAMRVQLGGLLVQTKSYSLALGELNRAIGINPRIAMAYEYRGLAYRGLGNEAQATRDIQFGRNTAQSSPQGYIEDLSFLNQ
jgi:tetratricopeptide (TPR) repeat protein